MTWVEESEERGGGENGKSSWENIGVPAIQTAGEEPLFPPLWGCWKISILFID
jgi:hypothetical protein